MKKYKHRRCSTRQFFTSCGRGGDTGGGAPILRQQNGVPQVVGSPQATTREKLSCTGTERGFTLIEVLIALIILAVALSGAVLAVQTSIRGTNHIYDKLAAHWVATNVIASMQVGLIPAPTDDTQTGEEEMLNRHFSWQAGVEQKSNGHYQRIYVDVSLTNTSTPLTHLVGFLSTAPHHAASSLAGVLP